MDLSYDRDTLIKIVKENPKLAISTVYKETFLKIYRYIYFRVYDESDAEDITEEVYIKLMGQICKYDGQESVTSWIYQIARTKIADFWRERYKLDKSFLSELVSSPDVEDENHEKAEDRVKEVLAALPANFAEVLKLRFLQGYSLEECAVKMNISLSNVKVLQHRALKKAGGML